MDTEGDISVGVGDQTVLKKTEQSSVRITRSAARQIRESSEPNTGGAVFEQFSTPVEVVDYGPVTEDQIRCLSREHTRWIGIGLGKMVYASWRNDQSYYYGQLIEEESKGKWKVIFYDGGNSTVSEDFIIPVDILEAGTVGYYQNNKDPENNGKEVLILGQDIVESSSDDRKRGFDLNKVEKYAVKASNEEVTLWCPPSCFSIKNTAGKRMKKGQLSTIGAQ